MVGADDAVQTEGWRRRGAAFFRKTARRSARKSGGDPKGAPAGSSGQTSAGGATSER